MVDNFWGKLYNGTGLGNRVKGNGREIMKKFWLAVLMIIMVGQTACGAESGSDLAEDEGQEQAVMAESTDNEQTPVFELTEENKEFLANICRTIDDFESPAEMDETFWWDFLFFTYTGLWGDDVEVVRIPREDLGFDETAIKVSYEEVQAYTELVFGVQWPDLKPAFEDMAKGQTSCYYEDGFYYIGVSDFPAYQFNFADCTVYEDGGTYAIVTYHIDFEDENNVGTITLTLEPADNANGFTIAAKTSEFSPDFS